MTLLLAVKELRSIHCATQRNKQVLSLLACRRTTRFPHTLCSILILSRKEENATHSSGAKRFFSQRIWLRGTGFQPVSFSEDGRNQNDRLEACPTLPFWR
jgi:hypothetical protein